MAQLLLAFHVFANTVWIGSIAVVGWLTAASARTEIAERGDAIAQVALQIYRRMANPAFFFSFGFGLARLLGDPETYMRLHWFHGKLAMAIVVIALHHVIGAKAKRAAGVDRTGGARGGSRQGGRSSAILASATLAFAFLTVTFAILKGQLVR